MHLAELGVFDLRRAVIVCGGRAPCRKTLAGAIEDNVQRARVFGHFKAGCRHGGRARR